MDLDFANSPRESQIDWLTTMIQNKIPQPQLPATSLESTPPLPTLYTRPSTSASQISFNLPSTTTTSVVATHAYDPFQAFKPKTVEETRELVFCMAALQPVRIDPESIKPPKRRNVRISKDPQSVAARLRRERISERIRILQRLVPGGTKMDTASMLDEAVQYMKFLKNQVKTMQRAMAGRSVQGLFLSASGIRLDKIQYPAFAKPAQLLSG